MNALCLFLLLIASPAVAETIELNRIIIQTSRSDDAYTDVTRPTTVITSKDIERYPAKSLSEIIGAQVGVYGVQYGNIKNSVIDIRGQGEVAATNVLVLIDGRRTNQIDLSGQDWALIDPSSIDHIEIIRGAATVLYGDNANGGVINIITKTGSKDSKPKLMFSEKWGSYQDNKYGFGLNGGASKVGYQMNYAHQNTTGYRANSNYWANDFNVKLDIDPTDTFNIDLNQGYHLDRYQLPGALFMSNIQNFGRTGVRSSNNNDRGTTSDVFMNITPRLKFTADQGDGELSLFTSVRKRNNKFHTGTRVYETMYPTDTYEFQPKLLYKIPITDRVQNKTTVGYDFFYAKAKRRSGYLDSVQDMLHARKLTHGAYVLDEVIMDDKLIVNAGIRRSWADYSFDQKTVISGKSAVNSSNNGYEAGLGYKYYKESKVYFDFARSYRLPALDEFFQNYYDFGFGLGGGLNSNLSYQVGNHYEIGIKDMSFDPFKWGVGLYTTQYKHEIYLDQVSFANTNYNGRTRHYGAEFEASTKLFNDLLEPFFNLSLQEARFRGGSLSGKNIPGIPDNMAHAGITYFPLKHVRTTMTVDHTGESFSIGDQQNVASKTKRWTTLDWLVAWQNNNVEVWFGIRNLFNRKYYAYAAYSSFVSDVGYYPAPTRNYSTGVDVKF